MKSVYIIIAIFALCSSSQLVSAECEDKGSNLFCQKWVQAFGKDICHWRFMPSSCAKACGYCELEGKCEDLYSLCERDMKNGKNMCYMKNSKIFCKKTCGFC